MNIAAKVSENMLLAGAGFLVTACVFFILIGFVLSVKVPSAETILGPLGLEDSGQGNALELNANNPNDAKNFSFLWIALLGLSLVVMFVGARLVFSSYSE